MKKIALWSVGALVAFVVLLAVKTPAAHIIYRLPLPNNIAISGVSGTLWDGRANQVMIDGLPIDNVRWQVKPLALLTGTLSLDVKGGNVRDTDAVSLNGPVQVSLFNPTHVQAQDLTLYLPTNAIIARAKLPIRVNMGGRFQLKLNDLSLAPSCQSLEGEGNWLNASVTLPQGATSLGSFAAKLSCSGEDIQMEVAEPNTLGLSFVSVFSTDLKRFNVTGKFKPDDDLPKAIHQAGRFFGTPDAQGYTEFTL